MKTKLRYVIGVLLFCSTLYAQKGFRIELGLGPVFGDARQYYSVDFQGKLYYLWQVSEQFDAGITAGFSIFTGNGNVDVFLNVPDGFIPLAVAGRVTVSKSFSVGGDVGYAINIAGDNGMYWCPVLIYKVKEKLAFTGSYSSISSRGYTSAAALIGVNFGF